MRGQGRVGILLRFGLVRREMLQTTQSKLVLGGTRRIREDEPVIESTEIVVSVPTIEPGFDEVGSSDRDEEFSELGSFRFCRLRRFTLEGNEWKVQDSDRLPP